MLLFLIQYLNDLGMKLPQAFEYASTRMLLACLTALFTTIWLGPYFIKKLYEMKTGQSTRVENCPVLAELHEKKKNTPTMGGILILFSMVLSLFLWMDLKNSFTLVLLISTLWLGALGAYDDYLKMKHKNSKGLSGKKKLVLQMLLGVGIVLYGFFPEGVQMGSWFVPPGVEEHIEKIHPLVADHLSLPEAMKQYFLPFYKEPLFMLSGGLMVVGGLITVFVITGASNGVNLTDGLDGLASGCVVMVSAVLGLVAFLSNNLEMGRYLNILYIAGSSEIAVYLFSMMGACLGFLWYNGYPAQVFMGDTGSLALGGLLGVCAVLLRRELLLGLVGGIFVAEALSVILQVGSYKLRNKKRIFLCAPLHHHFEYKGWPETKVVLRFWVVSLILAVVGIVSLKLQ